MNDLSSVNRAHERQPRREAERTEIGGMSDETVMAWGDELVLWFDAEVEDEEWSEGFKIPRRTNVRKRGKRGMK